MNWDTTLLDKLTRASIQKDTNPHFQFEWPEALPEDGWWMSRELLSVHDTALAAELDEAALRRLSKWESLHFYSLNVHGIRELLGAVVARLHRPGYEALAEFFHRFVAEENDHMWYFARFCARYGGKLYPDRAVALGAAADPALDGFLVFARILVFEELVDHFNTRMAHDEALHPFIRRLNQAHQRDEARHIAAGRHIVAALAAELPAAARAEARAYLGRYLRASVESLYEPAAYADAGLPEPYRVRRRLLEDPARARHHEAFLGETTRFLARHDLLAEAA